MTTVLSVVHGNTFGGPHNSNVHVGKFLQSHYGVRTIVLVPKEPGNAVERLAQQGIEVVQVPVHRIRAKLDPRYHWRLLVGFRRTVKQMQAIMRQQKVDVVQINGVSNPHAAVAARREGIPIVWQVLDTFPPTWFLRMMMPYALRVSASFMSTGRLVASAHPGLAETGDRLVCFYPPVDVDRFRWTQQKAAAARSELGIPVDATVVGNVSNLNPQKGHGTFIRAMGRLKKRHASLRFVILGKVYDAHRAHYEMLLRTAQAAGLRVGEDLIIRDPGMRVAELEMAFDLFAMTSEPRSEGIPTVIEEAMSLGLPVVSTNTGSISEAVQDGETGVLVPCGDDAAVADALHSLIEDPERRRRFGEAARRFAIANFAVKQCADRHRAAYEIALGCGLDPVQA